MKIFIIVVIPSLVLIYFLLFRKNSRESNFEGSDKNSDTVGFEEHASPETPLKVVGSAVVGSELTEIDLESSLFIASKHWRGRVSSLSGEWESTSDVVCNCEIHDDYRYISFQNGNTWSDLDGRSFILGSTLRFMTDNNIFLIKPKDLINSKYQGFTILKHSFKRDFYHDARAEMTRKSR